MVAHSYVPFPLGYINYEATTLLQTAFGYLFYESTRDLLICFTNNVIFSIIGMILTAGKELDSPRG